MKGLFSCFAESVGLTFTQVNSEIKETGNNYYQHYNQDFDDIGSYDLIACVHFIAPD